VSSPLDALSDDERALARRARKPRALEPMKAVLHDPPFSDPDWVFEQKLDGIRCLAWRDGDDVRLVSRTGKPLDFPDVSDALASAPCGDFIADGEVVAFENGVTSFSKLQRRKRERVDTYLYAFDLPYADGHDLTRVSLRGRKKALLEALDFGDRVHFSRHVGERGEDLYREACRSGLEGLIAKRADSPYRAGGRSRDWLKLKCKAEQELVIGGFSAPKGSREELGALLVGYWEDGELRYAGKVGTGFDVAMLRELGPTLRKLERGDPPFADVSPIPKDTTWVEPELVAQIGFSEWTRDGRLRHPRFLGMRDDKPAREVVRERPS
jgi:bifunctional non-homologous end joining protein LigD